MSVWSTKSLERDKNYIVLQHTLKGINYIINGVKFRNGYAVVEKDSKTYNALKKIPVLRSCKELPLTFLRKLNFVTKTVDIKYIYGQDVYRRFLEEEEKERQSQAFAEEQKQEALEQISIQVREEEVKLKENIEKIIEEAKAAGESEEVIHELQNQIPEIHKCSFRVENGSLCGQKALDYSPANYCHHHILNDPAIDELGIKVPQLMTKKEKKAFKEKLENVLTKAFKK